MFRCQNNGCDTVVEPHQCQNKVVTETRSKSYNRVNKETREVEIVNGWEIVKEIAVCPSCYESLTGEKPIVVESIPQSPSVRQSYKPTRPKKDSRKEPKIERISKAPGLSRNTSRTNQNRPDSTKS